MQYQKSVSILVFSTIVVLWFATGLTGCQSRQVQDGLTLSDFGFLKLGMSLEEIVDEVGDPVRDVGSGMFLIQYDLIDGRIVQLTFVNPDELLGAQVQDSDGTWVDILDSQ